MMPKNFKDLAGRVSNPEITRLEFRLGLLKRRVSTVEDSLKRQELVQRLSRYLVNGETMGGFFGTCPTYAMFVRQYKMNLSSKLPARMELVEADMVIVPELLVEHVLRVDIPNPTDLGRRTNSPEKVGVSDIVHRMLRYMQNAKNVSVGTFADVLCEPCAKCGELSPVAAFDMYLDDDNGREFTVRRICGACSQVDLLAYYSGRYEEKDPQYCLTDGIYRQ